MTETLFWVTYVALWLLCALLVVSVLLLYRYLGAQLLNGAARQASQGPVLGAELRPLLSRFGLEPGAHRPLLLFFASTTCGPCLEMRSTLSRFAERSRGRVETLLVCRGEPDEVEHFAEPISDSVRRATDRRWEIGRAFGISSTPFVLLADAGAFLRAKGTPTGADSLEAMLQQMESATAVRSPIVLNPVPRDDGVAIGGE